VLRIRNPDTYGNTYLDINTFMFKDGQPHVSSEIRYRDLCIEASISSSNDLLRVLLLNDILVHNGATGVSLFITYLLGARMDRRMPVDNIEDGEFKKRMYHPFTLGVISDLIATAHFEHISILDPHSDVAPAMLHADVVPPDEYVQCAIEWTKPTLLIAPDAGAAKKVEKLGEKFTLPVVQAIKSRNPQTGELGGCKIFTDSLKGEHVLIVDDICDGGRTFENIASVAMDMDVETVSLYTTHGIFSKGLPLAGIDKVVTTNSYQEQKLHSFLHTILI